MTRVLITGGKGRLGRVVTNLMQADPTYTHITSIDHDELDVTDFNAVRATVYDLKPDAVVHCAAWTDVDGCAHEPQRAIVSNGLGAGNVAAASANIGASMLYVSSNEVFDGERNTLYTEHDMPNPVNPYGWSKYVGEQEVVRLNPKHYIVRTSWLFAHGGKNFMQSMIGAAKAGKNLRVVTDEVANPTYTDDLAAAMIALLKTGRHGTYHLANAGAVSRWTFARYILDRAGFADMPIGKISKAQWPRPSTPPTYCGLENIHAAHLGITLRDWREAVDEFLAKEGLLADA